MGGGSTCSPAIVRRWRYDLARQTLCALGTPSGADNSRARRYVLASLLPLEERGRTNQQHFVASTNLRLALSRSRLPCDIHHRRYLPGEV